MEDPAPIEGLASVGMAPPRESSCLERTWGSAVSPGRASWLVPVRRSSAAATTPSRSRLWPNRLVTVYQGQGLGLLDRCTHAGGRSLCTHGPSKS